MVAFNLIGLEEQQKQQSFFCADLVMDRWERDGHAKQYSVPRIKFLT